MSHPTRPRPSERPGFTNSATRTASPITGDNIWRCSCKHVLGVIDGGRLHIRFARGHQYRAGFPASCICRHCGELNEIESACGWAEQLSERL
jgi:hypothetical protein